MVISIIGGGITGLATALALQKMGMDCTVYERAEQLNEIGAGVWLQPNAIQILKWLNVYDDILREGCVLNKMEITDSNLKPLKRVREKVVTDDHGNQTVAIHRGKLQRILLEKLTLKGKVKLGMPYRGHTEKSGRLLLFIGEEQVETDLLIGADGIHSLVRDRIGLLSEYRQTDQICCRGISEVQLPTDLLNEGKEMWGKKKRFGFSQISKDQVYFFAVVNKEICPPQLDKESLSNSFNTFHPITKTIIARSSHLHVVELSDLKRLETWHRGNVCLLGDAAHATTPNMGQGACQGIEDAFQISQSLHTIPHLHEALEHFESSRRGKVDYVVKNSWRFGKMVHNPTSQILMKTIMKVTPTSTIQNQMRTLYRVNGLR